MAAIAHYIKGELPEARRTLREVDLVTLLRSDRVQRWRLLMIATGVWPVLRLPRNEWLAQRMLDRWHTKHPPRRRRPA